MSKNTVGNWAKGKQGFQTTNKGKNIPTPATTTPTPEPTKNDISPIRSSSTKFIQLSLKETSDDTQLSFEQISTLWQLTEGQSLVQRWNVLSNMCQNSNTNFHNFVRKQLLPQQIQNDIRYVAEYANEIEFLNHNEESLAKGREWITLQDLLDEPELMQNNCESLSSAIEEDNSNWYMTVLLFNKGIHVATTRRDENDIKWVVDWTARQYGEQYPTPYIAPYDIWKAEILERVKILYDDKLLGQ